MSLRDGWTARPLFDPVSLIGGSWVAQSPTTAKSLTTSYVNVDSISRRSPKYLIEESMIGWKEYEMEVMRDLDDNVVIICCDRELRSDGRPHGRLYHRCSGARR